MLEALKYRRMLGLGGNDSAFLFLKAPKMARLSPSVPDAVKNQLGWLAAELYGDPFSGIFQALVCLHRCMISGGRIKVAFLGKLRLKPNNLRIALGCGTVIQIDHIIFSKYFLNYVGSE